MPGTGMCDTDPGTLAYTLAVLPVGPPRSTARNHRRPGPGRLPRGKGVSAPWAFAAPAVCSAAWAPDKEHIQPLPDGQKAQRELSLCKNRNWEALGDTMGALCCARRAVSGRRLLRSPSGGGRCASKGACAAQHRTLLASLRGVPTPPTMACAWLPGSFFPAPGSPPGTQALCTLVRFIHEVHVLQRPEQDSDWGGASTCRNADALGFCASQIPGHRPGTAPPLEAEVTMITSLHSPVPWSWSFKFSEPPVQDLVCVCQR